MPTIYVTFRNLGARSKTFPVYTISKPSVVRMIAISVAELVCRRDANSDVT